MLSAQCIKATPISTLYFVKVLDSCAPIYSLHQISFVTISLGYYTTKIEWTAAVAMVSFSMQRLQAFPRWFFIFVLFVIQYILILIWGRAVAFSSHLLNLSSTSALQQCHYWSFIWWHNPLWLWKTYHPKYFQKECYHRVVTNGLTVWSFRLPSSQMVCYAKCLGVGHGNDQMDLDFCKRPRGRSQYQYHLVKFSFKSEKICLCSWYEKLCMSILGGILLPPSAQTPWIKLLSWRIQQVECWNLYLKYRIILSHIVPLGLSLSNNLLNSKWAHFSCNNNDFFKCLCYY